jgi:hypothetical protein
MLDIKHLFTTLDNLNIVEIGGGYGGQCKILNDIFSIKNYTIIDLEEANMLQKKYLSKLNITNIEFQNNLSYKSESYDFCISNYAFSECNKDIQRKYLDDIVLKSKHGYMINNRKEDYSKEDLIEIIPNSKLLPEIPLTGNNNYVIYW